MVTQSGFYSHSLHIHLANNVHMKTQLLNTATYQINKHTHTLLPENQSFDCYAMVSHKLHKLKCHTAAHLSVQKVQIRSLTNEQRDKQIEVVLDPGRLA